MTSIRRGAAVTRTRCLLASPVRASCNATGHASSSEGVSGLQQGLHMIDCIAFLCSSRTQEGYPSDRFQVWITCKSFLIGFWPVEVPFGDIGPIDADLPNLACWHKLVLLVQDAHLHMSAWCKFSSAWYQLTQRGELSKPRVVQWRQRSGL